MEPVSPQTRRWTLNHWISREALLLLFSTLKECLKRIMISLSPTWLLIFQRAVIRLWDGVQGEHSCGDGARRGPRMGSQGGSEHSEVLLHLAPNIRMDHSL